MYFEINAKKADLDWEVIKFIRLFHKLREHSEKSRTLSKITHLPFCSFSSLANLRTSESRAFSMGC